MNNNTALEIGAPIVLDGKEYKIHFVSREVYTAKENGKAVRDQERVDLIAWRDLNETTQRPETPELMDPQEKEWNPPTSSRL